MNAQRCLEILREIKDVAFATVDRDGLPQIRIIDVMIVEDEKLYFCTSRGKEFYRQLTENGQVAITGMTKNFQMVRLNGKAVRLTAHKEWIDRIFAENPSMNGVYPEESRYVLEAFCIDHGVVEFFDLSKEPIVRESFSLGNTKLREVGFHITDDCIKCGKCERCCPQKCIENFTINQKHCLHCGLCFEECPVKAIKRRGE
ncbi:MAG: pyridoxamine 5'-phosphate oxidase family protein [Lachnospiraceae bacterium]|nr:pyridoxamine 5'-phosphate oxidase family protein [Lachnospiraceae bacterium]